jgi:putative restriction endonuclease
MPSWGPERDLALRRAAMAWLAVRTNDGLDPVSSQDLAEFTFEGVRVPLVDRQRGIRKPAVLDAALSIRTVFRPEGAARPYEDAQGPDGLIRYKWRGDDGDPGAVDPHGGSALERTLERRYVLAETKRRLHQPVFRATVMRAYATRCAVCALRHGELLDAAHIVPDTDERGIASVRNGLALCKIHHAAFDAGILGIRPDQVVEIRADLLDEVDGPMLRYGLQERHGQPLMVLPTVARERPDRTLLEVQYERFRSAS